MKIPIVGAMLMFIATSVVGAEVGKLDLSGFGKVSAEPNVGYITLGLTTRNVRSNKALEANANAMVKVYASLAKQGIEKKDIHTVTFSIQKYCQTVTENHGRDSFTSEQIGFEVSNFVRVTVSDPANFGKVLDMLVLDEGNYVSEISFGSTDASKHYDEARQIAVKDACRKAKILTETSGMRLGDIISIDEEPQQALPRYLGTSMTKATASKEVSDRGLEFIVNVHIVWEIIPEDE